MSESQTSFPVTRPQAAALCGMKPRTFDQYVRPRLSPDAMQGAGRHLRYDARAVVVALMNHHEAARGAPGARSVTDADELLIRTAGNSPSLERWRQARSRMAELDLAERERKLVPVGEVEAPMTDLTTILRSATERVQRQYGNGPAAIWNEAIDEWEAGWLEAAQQLRSNGDADPERVSTTDRRAEATRA